jgi:NOL1/NOP2/sun family putative RNA methylase
VHEQRSENEGITTYLLMKIRQDNILNIPAAFLDRMSGLLKEEYPAFLSSLQLPAVSGLRVNTLKTTISEFLNQSPWRLSPIGWCPNGFIFDIGQDTITPPGKHPFHTAGLYYLQEPSAMVAAEILAPQPGEKVLDLAAAPGGKATHLAALMRNTGLLVANDIHPKRVWDLVENLERCGVTNAVVTNETAERLADHFGEYFDRVLLDAPCSGEGMFRKGDVARLEWKPEISRSCAIRQAGILEQAARLVKPGGYLAYTTCTFSPDEDEGVVANFLSHHPDYKIASIQNTPGFSFARPEWVGLPPDDSTHHAVRIWPHLAPGEGHFIALLVKQDGLKSHQSLVSQCEYLREHIRSSQSETAYYSIDKFCSENLRITFDHSRLLNMGTRLYLLPEIMPDFTGLHVIHPGWWLGSIRKDRFTPSHALAMGITSPQARHVFPMALMDTRLSTYLVGETFLDSGENTWLLFTVSAYSIGWGKRVQNVIKNYFPHALRKRA